MRLKRLTAILLCLCMALTLLPTAALAADEGQTIYVGGVALTSTEATPTVYARTVGGAVTTGGASATSYNIKWDGETLTLNGATITQGSHENAAIYFCDNSSLVLTGTNTVTGPAVKDGNSYGIYAAGSEEDITLTISGEGSLTATGGSASGEYLGSSGIQGDRIIINSGRVTAVGGKSDEYSYGVQAFYQVTINNGTVSAQGNAQTSISWGIFAMEDLGVCGAYLKACFGGAALWSGADWFRLRNYGVLFIVLILASTTLGRDGWQRLPKRAQQVLTPVLMVLSLVLSTAYLVDGSYNPFLYFRF